MNFIKNPILYKKSSTGDIQVWSIYVMEPLEFNDTYPETEPLTDPYPVIVVSFGKYGGRVQVGAKPIKEGKNIGRTNETSPLEQAMLEAQSIWNKKKDSGYFNSIEESQEELVLLPMLAHTYEKRKHNIVWPCYVQPKLDGIRCFCYKDSNGNVVLMSRKGKFFKTLKHIEKAAEWIPQHMVLDGELFSDEIPFESITGAVRRETVATEQEAADVSKIGLRVYDCYSMKSPDTPFRKRREWYEWNIYNMCTTADIIYVPTYECNNELEMKNMHDAFVLLGHEGIMLRNIEGVYKLKDRSPDLQKYKHFQDSEFKIVGAKEGSGKDAGTVIWVCEVNNTTFDVRPRGTHAVRSNWFSNKELYIGMSLTVRYQELSEKGIPRFPVGLTPRDYE